FIVLLPKLTDDLDRVGIMGFYSEDFNIYSAFKLLLMCLEMRMCEDYNLKDIVIIDFNNITAMSVTKITLPAVKKFAECSLKGYNSRIKSVHIINSSPITEVLVTIIKTLLRNKLVDRVHVHGSDLTELYKHVPRSMLPKEYGGENGTINQHYSVWKNKMKSYRNWFIEHEKKKSDETKRPNGQGYNSDLFGYDGSFRQLSID
ncbi:hypothetical protein L9F63_010704, partial [Diploptera punctata]